MRNFEYNATILFRDLGSGIVGDFNSEANILVLPDNWLPTPNTKAICDIVLSKDFFPFEGKNVQLAFARLSPNFPQPEYMSVDWKKILAPQTLFAKRPPNKTFDGITVGDLVLWPAVFLSDGTFKVLRHKCFFAIRDEGAMIRVRDNHTFNTDNLCAAFKNSGKVAMFKLPPEKTVQDISHFRVKSIFPNYLTLRPKFLPIEESIRFFHIPENFEHKRLDIEAQAV